MAIQLPFVHSFMTSWGTQLLLNRANFTATQASSDPASLVEHFNFLHGIRDHILTTAYRELLDKPTAQRPVTMTKIWTSLPETLKGNYAFDLRGLIFNEEDRVKLEEAMTTLCQLDPERFLNCFFDLESQTPQPKPKIKMMALVMYQHLNRFNPEDRQKFIRELKPDYFDLDLYFIAPYLPDFLKAKVQAWMENDGTLQQAIGPLREAEAIRNRLLELLKNVDSPHRLEALKNLLEEYTDEDLGELKKYLDETNDSAILIAECHFQLTCGDRELKQTRQLSRLIKHVFTLTEPDAIKAVVKFIGTLDLNQIELQAEDWNRLSAEWLNLAYQALGSGEEFKGSFMQWKTAIMLYNISGFAEHIPVQYQINLIHAALDSDIGFDWALEQVEQNKGNEDTREILEHVIPRLEGLVPKPGEIAKDWWQQTAPDRLAHARRVLEMLGEAA